VIFKIKELIRSVGSKSIGYKIFFSALTLVAFCSILFISFFLLVWAGGFGPIPDSNELRMSKNPKASEIYSADSVLLGRYYLLERSDITFNEIPAHVKDAILATEDVRFFKHGAIDLRSLFRVVVKSILFQDESSGGGSTLTQQLAKNLYPRQKYFAFSILVNKMREIIIASKLENIYSKEELLVFYLNTVPFGDNTFGIEAASLRFFSKPTRNLSIEEGAVLIGMLKATYYYNPRVFPHRALQRRNVVLSQMVKYGFLQKNETDYLKRQSITLTYNKVTHHSGTAPYFREFIRQELLKWCQSHQGENQKPYNLYTDGLKIFTTIDSRLQHYAEESVGKQMALIQNQFDKQWKWTKKFNASIDELVKKTNRYKFLKEKGLSDNDISIEMKKPLLMNVFTWDGEKELNMSPRDSIKHYLKFLNAGVLGMDPDDGSIRVWVGGINHNFFQFDHVKKGTKRQVGSTFKPIVYAAALEQGVQPCEYTSAELTTYNNAEVNNREWTPKNSNEEYYKLKFSMEGALAYSVNTVSVKILEAAGISNVINLAHKLGIESEMPEVPSLALGVADISMTELISAYSGITNGGRKIDPFYITSIVSSNGAVLETFHPSGGEQVLSNSSAQMVVQMLKRSVNEGTAAGLRTRFTLLNEMAGKTGTTQSNTDGWFVAMTPRLVIGAWVGADDPRVRFTSTSMGQGAATALPIVGQFFTQVNENEELAEISKATFQPLPENLRDKLTCDLFKEDATFLERLFGKKETDKEPSKIFGEEKKPKKGFLKRLFGRNN
jgi:penicillin-binding protein 1A